jgi:hypothetical protein
VHGIVRGDSIDPYGIYYKTTLSNETTIMSPHKLFPRRLPNAKSPRYDYFAGPKKSQVTQKRQCSQVLGTCSRCVVCDFELLMSDHPPPVTTTTSSGTGGGRGGMLTLLQSRYYRNAGLVALVIIGVLALSSEGMQSVSLLSSSSTPSTLALLAKEEQEEPSSGQQRLGGDRGGGGGAGNSSYSITVHQYNAAVRDMVGEWLGQTWVPPHPWRLFGPSELLAMYQDTKMLWIGDSTGRRSFATMYAILQETAHDKNGTTQHHHVSTKAMDHHTVIDVNKKSTTEFCTKWSNNETMAAAKLNNVPYPSLCRPTPAGNNRSSSSSSSSSSGQHRGGEFSYASATCYSTIENLLASELAGTTNFTADVDVIVIAVGIWEVQRKGDCDYLERGNKNNDTKTLRKSAMQRLDFALQVAAKFTNQTGKIIIWRTAGYGFGPTIAPMNVLNNRTMDFIDSLENGDDSTSNDSNNNRNSLMYVNWGGAVQPRSFGEDNIVGDMAPHYGK